ncbi:MAG: adenosine deaminase [Akkermansiaceae bacterium]
MDDGTLNGLSGKELVRAIHFEKLPKVLLHEHLDGGLRPSTILELAADRQYSDLPESNPEDLEKWFHRGARTGSLSEFLEGFQHTIAVMQTKEALERVAYEFIEDMHNDGVVYAEVRFAPLLHTAMDLKPDEVVNAVLKGLRRGENDFGVKWGLIICALRNLENSLESAELAIRWREAGVVGFDLAGEESGYPPKKHIEAFHAIERANFYITIHAGEAFGLGSIWQALQYCGAHRLGHALHLQDDIEEQTDGSFVLGTLAQYVLDRRIPLEMCPSSNLCTGACHNLKDHPFGLFFKNGFRVCLNTDDRLMCDTSMTKETIIATEAFNFSLADIEKLNINAMKSAFAPYETRRKLITDVIAPSYAAIRE